MTAAAATDRSVARENSETSNDHERVAPAIPFVIACIFAPACASIFEGSLKGTKKYQWNFGSGVDMSARPKII